MGPRALCVGMGVMFCFRQHSCLTLQIFAAMAGSPVLSVPVGVYPADTAVVKDSRNGLVEVAPGIP